MTVVTISAQLGSEATRIAQDLARSLGCQLADKNTFAAVLSHYGLAEFAKEYGVHLGFWGQFSARRAELREEIKRMLHDTTLALAHHGDMVLLGRGAFPIISSFDDVLTVRIQARPAVRVARVMEREGITDSAQARTFVANDDALRAAFVRSIEGTTADIAGLYDLVIDTGRIPPDRAVTWLVEATEILKGHQGSSGRTTDSIAVDPLLASTVSAVLSAP